MLGVGAVVGAVLGFEGQSALFWGLFLATSGPLTLWVLMLGAILWRRLSQPAGVRPA